MKRPKFTLIEVLVALTLTGLLLSALFGVYWQIQVATRVGLKAEERNFHLLYAQMRLTQVLSAIEADTQKRGEKQAEYFFYLSENPQALTFTYDNGTGAGADFSNSVIGKLLLNNKEQLVLYTWPAISRHPEENPPFRKEILLEKVLSVEYSFYRPPQPKMEGRDIDPGNTSDGYNTFTDFWPLERYAAPAVIKMTIEQKELKPITFTFAMPSQTQRIVYP